MQNKPVNILFTRPLDALLVQKAGYKKIVVDTATFIITTPVTTNEVKEKIEAFKNQKATVVFTSTNAVEAVVLQLKEKPDWDIYCIGGATKDAVIDFFGETRIKALGKSAASLADKIIAAGEVKEVVFFCGDQRLTTLPETLEANGIHTIEIGMYETILTPQLIEKNYNGVSFFSPSAVHSFFELNTVGINVILFAIGKTTAATIGSYCSNKIVTCEWPGSEQMIDSIIHYFDKN